VREPARRGVNLLSLDPRFDPGPGNARKDLALA
jgi:hypothetical protein